MKFPSNLSGDDLGVIFAFSEPSPMSRLQIALFSINLLATDDVLAALGYLGLKSNSSQKGSSGPPSNPRYIFGVAFCGGWDYLEVSALEFDCGTFICGIERGPHYESHHGSKDTNTAGSVHIQEAKGAILGRPFTLLPPAAPSFGEEDEDEDDFDESEARPRDLEVSLSDQNNHRVLFLQHAWREAVEYRPEYLEGAEAACRPRLKKPVSDLRDYLNPLKHKADNLFWYENWKLENFEKLNANWDAFTFLQPTKSN